MGGSSNQMITIAEYFGIWRHDSEHTKAAYELIKRVNALLEDAEENGVKCPINPVTKSQISGERFGGFRPQDCPIGAQKSAHKTGEAVDIYDPNNEIDNWITDKILEKHDLYRESPQDTLTWLHLSTRPPKSGKRTFKP